MKRCSTCKIEKPFEEFNKNKTRKDGYHNQCRCCVKKYKEENKDKLCEYDKKYYEENKNKISEQQKQYREENKHKISEQQKQYYEENKYKISQKQKQYYEENKDKISEQQKQYYEENKDKICERNRLYYLLNTDLHFAKAAKYRACKLCATPKWLTEEHYAQMVDIYKEREILTEITGILYHVDHIVPLQGETVCGLHVPWNLQVIPATENLSKSNKLMEELLEELFLQQKGEVENYVENSSEDHL